ncbi:MAG: HIT domain-containing protein [Nanoarchaeota archaeon]|nr:HIT domain-containing protein [Nanoarchaeota archaeon]
MDCLFCGIVQGKIPSFKIYEDDSFLAFLDINPANPGHTVLIPKAHYGSIMEMQEVELSRFFLIARAISLALLEYGAEGVNFLYSMGQAAGQRSPHMLLHIIPRYKDDGLILEPPRKKATEEELKAQQQKISQFIGKPQAPQKVQQKPVEQKEIKQEKVEKKIYELPRRTGGYWRY